jgi:hypothetical protein
MIAPLNVFARGADYESAADALEISFAAATPFAHVVIDGLFDEATLDAAVNETPTPFTDHTLYSTHKPGQSERKFALRDWSRFGETTFRLFSVLQSGLFTRFLERVTGIDGLIADPTLEGGGYHMILRDGFLSVHADFNVHAKLKLRRRLNVLIYLNREWAPEWGGDLELWERDMSACAVKIAPLFNRTVIFETTSTSFHGHPHPLGCPDDVLRRSIALYYYTADAASVAPHSTLYQKIHR